jgi:hypothetical protein
MNNMAAKKVPTTITMPKALLKKWLAALRSGNFRQAAGTLRDPKTGGMCCLGVLQYCTKNSAKAIEKDISGEYVDLPSLIWLKEHGIKFKSRRWDGKLHLTNNPILPTLDDGYGSLASEANDSTHNGKHQYNFKAIADAIEACAVGV